LPKPLASPAFVPSGFGIPAPLKTVQKSLKVLGCPTPSGETPPN